MSSFPPLPRFVILAAIDASAATDRIVTAAAGFARSFAGAEVHLAHAMERVGPEKPTPNDPRERARALLDRNGRALTAQLPETRVVSHLCVGAPWLQIVHLAAKIQADLVMVGTHERSALQRLVVGSVAEMIVRKATCPVIVVRAKDHTYHDGAEIEPPCPQCVEAQRASRGAQLWCERHDVQHIHGELHYEYPEPFGTGAELIHT